MLHSSLSQTLIFVYIIITGSFVFILSFYQREHKIRYKNDERWQLIQLKSNQVLRNYFDTLVVIFAFLVVIDLFVDIKTSFSFGQMINYGIYILFLKYPIEYFALRHYDKVL